MFGMYLSASLGWGSQRLFVVVPFTVCRRNVQKKESGIRDFLHAGQLKGLQGGSQLDGWWMMGWR